MIAIAIEKFIMGFLMYNGDMADMIRSMERHLQLPPAIVREN